MTPEDRLRRAIAARTSSVEPRAEGLAHIEAGLDDARRRDRRRRLALRVTSMAAAVAIVATVVALARDDDEVRTEPTGTTTTTQPPTSTSTTGSTTTTTTFAPSVDPAVPIWPLVDSAQRFDDPVAAARSFAVELVGMTDPVMGELQAGDARSGEVPVRPTPQGPVTTVIVRQLEDDTWYVLGASAADIRLDSPAAGERIDCPARLTGEALAFEGHVDVAILADGVEEPIGTGYVQGGGGPSLPFDGVVDCDASTLAPGHHGAVVLYTIGGEDERVWMATVVRIALT